MLRTTPRSWLMVTMLLAAPEASFANGATYGGSGADVYPIENHQVSMRREHIGITPEGDDAGWGTSAVAFDCKFWFVNHGDSTTVRMGFPLAADSSGWEGVPDSASLGFHVEVDGAPVTFRSAQKGRVFLWPVVFAEGQERSVRVTYTLPWSSGDLNLYPLSTNYVLRTGALWRDPIEESVIEARFGPRTPLVALSFRLLPTRFEGGVVRWEFHDVRPAEDLSFRFSPDIAAGFEGHFTGPVDFAREARAKDARELLELLDLEWEETLEEQPTIPSDLFTSPPPDTRAMVEQTRVEIADSALAACDRLARRERDTGSLTAIERMNLGYARAVEKVCRRKRPLPKLQADLRAIHKRFW